MSFPTTTDLTHQTQAEFENIGNEIEPIEVGSDVQAENEIEWLIKKIQKTEDWDEQVTAINHGMSLVIGGALNYDCFRRGIYTLYTGLLAAATNLRSALLKNACLFITLLAKQMGPKFDTIGEYITPLSGMLAHGTQIIAESCKFTIIEISKYAYSKKILSSILDLSKSKGSVQRLTSAECLNIITSTWRTEIFMAKWDELSKNLLKLLCDASAEVRYFARSIARNLLEIEPKKTRSLIVNLDSRTLKAIEEGEPEQRPLPTNSARGFAASVRSTGPSENTPEQGGSLSRTKRAQSQTKKPSTPKSVIQRAGVDSIGSPKTTKSKGTTSETLSDRTIPRRASSVKRTPGATISSNTKSAREKLKASNLTNDPEKISSEEAFAAHSKTGSWNRYSGFNTTRNTRRYSNGKSSDSKFTANRDDNQSSPKTLTSAKLRDGLESNNNEYTYSATRTGSSRSNSSKKYATDRGIPRGPSVNRNSKMPLRSNLHNEDNVNSVHKRQHSVDNTRRIGEKPPFAKRQQSVGSCKRAIPVPHNYEKSGSKTKKINNAQTIETSSVANDMDSEENDETLSNKTNNAQPTLSTPSKIKPSKISKRLKHNETEQKLSEDNTENKFRISPHHSSGRQTPRKEVENDYESKQSIVPLKEESPQKLQSNPMFVMPVLRQGEEVIFLNAVRAVIETGQTAELTPAITSIAASVSRCCLQQSSSISKNALSLLHDLIPPFAHVFRNALAKLLALLFKTSMGPDLVNASLSNRVLDSLPDVFEPRDLVKAIISQPFHDHQATLRLFSKIAKRGEGLSDEKLCFKILDMTVKYGSAPDVKIRHLAGEVLTFLCEYNRTMLTSYYKNLSDTTKFLQLGKSYLPASMFTDEATELPKYNSKNYRKWVVEMEALSNNGSDWNVMCGDWYKAVNAVLEERSSDVHQILIVVQKAMTNNGVRDFHRIIPGLLKHSDEKAADNIFAIAMERSSPLEFVDSIQTYAESDDISVSSKALDLLSRWINTASLPDVRKCIPTITSTLAKTIASSEPSVRRMSVTCYVELKNKADTDVTPIIEGLTVHQQRIINAYYTKRRGG